MQATACDANPNRLLHGLPSSEQARLEPHLTVVDLPSGQMCSQAGQKIVRVYFPCTAIVSLFSRTAENKCIEVAMVGAEGIVGVSAWLGEDAVANEVVQIPGAACSMDADEFNRQIDQSQALYYSVQACTIALLTRVIRSAGCYAHHTVEQRAASWLIMADARSLKKELPMPQELFSLVLGIRRQTAARVLNEFEDRRLIDSPRGRLKVIDPQGLQAVACTCYHPVRSHYPHIFA